MSLQGRADVLEDEVLLDDAFILAAMSDTDSQNALADLDLKQTEDWFAPDAEKAVKRDVRVECVPEQGTR